MTVFCFFRAAGFFLILVLIFGLKLGFDGCCFGDFGATRLTSIRLAKSGDGLNRGGGISTIIWRVNDKHKASFKARSLLSNNGRRANRWTRRSGIKWGNESRSLALMASVEGGSSYSGDSVSCNSFSTAGKS